MWWCEGCYDNGQLYLLRWWWGSDCVDGDDACVLVSYVWMLFHSVVSCVEVHTNFGEGIPLWSDGIIMTHKILA